MSPRRPLLVLCLIFVCLFSSYGAYGAPRSAATQRVPASGGPLPVVDNFEAPLASGAVGTVPIGFFIAQDGGTTTTFSATDVLPAAVPGSGAGNKALRANFNVSSYGVVIHGFENPAVDAWVSQDWSPYAGFEFWLYGLNSGTSLFIDIIDNRTPGSTTDDGERFTTTIPDNFAGWQKFQIPFTTFVRKEIGNGAPNDGFTLSEVHGWALGALSTGGSTRTYYMDDVAVYGVAPPRPLEISFNGNGFATREGTTATVNVKLSRAYTQTVTIDYATSDAQAVAGRDYTPASGTLTFAPGSVNQSFTVATIDDGKYEGDEGVLLTLSNPSAPAVYGLPNISRLAIQDNESYDPLLVNDFEQGHYLLDASPAVGLATEEITPGGSLALPGQGAYENILAASYPQHSTPLTIEQEFPQGRNWSAHQGLDFWYYGRNSGETVKVNLLDNRAADPGPSGWTMAWNDEFNDPAGTPPDNNTWSHEIGDGTQNGNTGWGNSELEYYTDDPANASADGAGNMVLTVREITPTGTLRCYYGPCKYTSARLISANKDEYAYGKIEARIQTPRGEGLWPAFWALGTDIPQVNWPQSGEIDIFEVVARLPRRVFATIHGPGYNGGNGFGSTIDLKEDVADNFHTISIEWQPNLIKWYIDGTLYHSAQPSNVAPNEWVFNHPFFLLLNVAVGGNFGGPVGAGTTFPQSMKVDYIRVYQAEDTAERFEDTFVDDFSGWRKIELPFSGFTRSATQPAGAPDDGLTLSSVWGYGFELAGGPAATLRVDQVRVKPNCASTTVSSAANQGAGSLRDVIAAACDGATITFAPGLAAATIALTAPLTINKHLTIDGVDAPGLALSGGGSARVLEIGAQGNLTAKNLTVRDGYGFELAGGILNNGTLKLDHVTVTHNTVTTAGVDFWKGGGGIYSGDASTLTLVDSIVSDNKVTQGDGGGIYAFFHTTVTISSSTIYSNTSTNVGGGIRTLGDALIVNSTLSENHSTGWHGGAFFHTDGALQIVNSTVVSNTAPAGTAGGVLVAAFTASSPSLTISNSIIAHNSGDECHVEDQGAGTPTLASGGHNIASDGTCALTAAGDLPSTDPLIGALADNGGPTWTHALLGGSPAIDAGDNALCPARDQRGTARPQGATCDIGAFEADAVAPPPLLVHLPLIVR